MNARQENQFGSYRTTWQVLTDNAALFAGVPAMATQIGVLDDSIKLIQALSASQGTDTTGIALAKKEFLRQMMVYAHRVAGGLKAYASVEGNLDLKAKAEITDTMFEKARDELKADPAQVVLDAANGLTPAALAPYGVTAATLSALQTRIDAYRLAVPGPSVARANRRSFTELLDQELRRAEMICRERLDGLMEQFHYEADDKTETAHFRAYKAARDIIDTGHRAATKAASKTPSTP